MKLLLYICDAVRHFNILAKLKSRKNGSFGNFLSSLFASLMQIVNADKATSGINLQNINYYYFFDLHNLGKTTWQKNSQAWALFMCQASRQRLWWYRRLVHVIILELSHAIVWFVWHVCSDKAELSFFERETAFWCSFKRVPNWRLVCPMYSWLQSLHAHTPTLLWIVTTVDYCQMLICISLIDDVTTQKSSIKGNMLQC